MKTPRIVFLHGLESGPHGSKYKGLARTFGNVTAPDCRGLDLDARVKKTLEHLRNEPAFLVGSSFGGLVGCLIATQRPDLVLGMLLCAPALHRKEAGSIQMGEEIPVRIIHGIHDDIVPIGTSRNAPWPLMEVEDGHQLSNSLPFILRIVEEMIS